jgi:hypothetical protein
VGGVINCECGFDARAADEEWLVAAVRRRADYSEPELQAFSGIRTRASSLPRMFEGGNRGCGGRFARFAWGSVPRDIEKLS